VNHGQPTILAWGGNALENDSLMHILHINLAGIIICATAFGAAFGIGHLAGIADEGPLMIVAGRICTVLDGCYRFRSAERRWFHAHVGGTFFFIPIWVLGIVWLVLGIVYTQRRPPHAPRSHGSRLGIYRDTSRTRPSCFASIRPDFAA
jgi:hypothetical protein